LFTLHLSIATFGAKLSSGRLVRPSLERNSTFLLNQASPGVPIALVV